MVLPPVPLSGARALVELDRFLLAPLLVLDPLFLVVVGVVLVFLPEGVRVVELRVELDLVEVLVFEEVRVVVLVLEGLGRLPRQLLPPNLDTIRRFRCYCCL